MKKTFFVIVLVVVLVISGITFINYQKESKTWKLKVTNDLINIRENHSPYEYKLGEVKFGEKYKILDIFLEDDKYVWYKIKTDKKQTGWIASERSNPYVLESNNPKYKDIKKYKLEYQKPVVSFFEEVYETKSLKSINYDHLTIVDDSSYKITHKVYIEEAAEEEERDQYWIQYIVRDIFDNETKKIQRIEFEVIPNKKDVLNFKTYKNK